MGYKQPNNPMKMMKSALKMYRDEKKSGVHRDSAMYMGHEESPAKMDSPMYRESAELKDKPILDIEKGDAKGSPAKMKKDSPMEKELVGKQKNLPEALKAKIEAAPESPAKMGHKKGSPAKAYSKGASGHGYTAGQYAAHQDQSIVKQNPKHVAAHSGSPAKKQGYNDRLDESLAKDGKESSKKQSMKDRRDESKGMEKSKGKGAYSSDPKMS